MWADTFLRAEQQHLLRLLLWSGLSIVAATVVAVIITARSIRSSLLNHFSIQMALWGGVLGVIAGIEWAGLQLRDVSGASRVERLLWMNIGLDIGYIAAGAALAAAAWVLARKMSGVGAGIAIVVQGLAILLIDLQFAAAVSR